MADVTYSTAREAKCTQAEAELAYLLPTAIVLGITTVMSLLALIWVAARRRSKDVELGEHGRPLQFPDFDTSDHAVVIWPETPAPPTAHPAQRRVSVDSSFEDINLSSVQKAQAVAIKPVHKVKSEVALQQTVVNVGGDPESPSAYTVRTVDVASRMKDVSPMGLTPTRV